MGLVVVTAGDGFDGEGGSGLGEGQRMLPKETHVGDRFVVAVGDPVVGSTDIRVGMICSGGLDASTGDDKKGADRGLPKPRTPKVGLAVDFAFPINVGVVRSFGVGADVG